MNKLITIPLLFIACIFMTSCLNDDEPKDVVKEIRMEVSAETGVTYHWGDDNQEHPIECMLVKLPDNPNVWQHLDFGSIEGFTYERGHEYYLSVRKTVLANPPADSPDCTYSLIKILSDKIIAEPEVPIDKDITSINDIEYQELCPFDKYAITPLYYIGGDGMISYSDGHAVPSYENARIYLENVLSKGNPNWVKFQSVSYQATYSYVFSPLSDKVRLVRNESSGPMFKNVVPENEYRHIVENMVSGEEIQYVMVLANVHKLGLQKVQFTIRKS